MPPLRSGGTGGAPLTPEEEAYFAQYEPSLAAPPPAGAEYGMGVPAADPAATYNVPAPTTPAYYPESQGGAPAPPPPQSMSTPMVSAPDYTASGTAQQGMAGYGNNYPDIATAAIQQQAQRDSTATGITPTPASPQFSPTAGRDAYRLSGLAYKGSQHSFPPGNTLAGTAPQGNQKQGSLLAQFYDDAANHARQMKMTPKKPTKAQLEAEAAQRGHLSGVIPPAPYNPSDPEQAINTSFLPTPPSPSDRFGAPSYAGYSNGPERSFNSLPTPLPPQGNESIGFVDRTKAYSQRHGQPPPPQIMNPLPSLDQEFNTDEFAQQVASQPKFTIPEWNMNWDAIKGVAGGRDTNFEQAARFAGTPTPHSPAMDRAATASYNQSPYWTPTSTMRRSSVAAPANQPVPPTPPLTQPTQSSQTTTPPANTGSFYPKSSIRGAGDSGFESRYGYGAADARKSGIVGEDGKFTDAGWNQLLAIPGLIDPNTGAWQEGAVAAGIVPPEAVGQAGPLWMKPPPKGGAAPTSSPTAGQPLDPNATLPVTAADVIAVESGSSGSGGSGGSGWVDYGSRRSSGGGGYSGGRSYGGGGGGYSGGGRSYGGGRSGGGGFDFGSSETGGSWEDFLEDFDGDGDTDEKDERKAKQKFAMSRKTRRGKRGGLGRGKSTLPSMTPSAQRTDILARLSDNLGRPIGGWPEGM